MIGGKSHARTRARGLTAEAAIGGGARKAIVVASRAMKSNTIWVLISGLAVGALIGQALPRIGGGSTGGEKSETAAKPNTLAAATPTEIPAGWLSADDLKATDKLAGLTAQQKYSVLRVMNEKPCDCGCPHGTTGKCLKDDPNCPRAPVILSKAIELAKAGKSYDDILAAVKKQGGDDKPAPAANQKVELAKWVPIEGPKLAKVTIVEFSDFQ